MATTWTEAPDMARHEPAIHRIGSTEVGQALALGWRDFLANPTQLVFLAILYPIIGLIAAQLAAGRDVMPLFWPLVSGFALLGPVAALGVYELSRRREQGQPTRWTDALAVRHSPALTSIIGLGVLLLAIFVAWIFTARAIYGMTLGDTPATATDFLSRVLYSREGHQLMLLGNLAGFLFAVLVFSLTVVSFPMLLDRAGRGLPVNARMAMRASLRAVRTNPGPLALWGFLIALLLALGSLPLFVGLAVVVPVLGHATWHLYRRIVRD